MSDTVMYLNTLDNVPHLRLPRGYGIRKFHPHRRDDKTWARIEVAAGGFPDMQSALERYQQWTSEIPGGMHTRCFFLVDTTTQEAIGTVTAWRGREEMEDLGRIHWVAIVPEHQGKGLAKPLVAHALRHLQREGVPGVYLKTDSSKPRALSVYSQLGFAESYADLAQSTRLGQPATSQGAHHGR